MRRSHFLVLSWMRLACMSVCVCDFELISLKWQMNGSPLNQWTSMKKHNVNSFYRRKSQTSTRVSHFNAQNIVRSRFSLGISASKSTITRTASATKCVRRLDEISRFIAHSSLLTFVRFIRLFSLICSPKAVCQLHIGHKCPDRMMKSEINLFKFLWLKQTHTRAPIRIYEKVKHFATRCDTNKN